MEVAEEQRTAFGCFESLLKKRVSLTPFVATMLKILSQFIHSRLQS